MRALPLMIAASLSLCGLAHASSASAPAEPPASTRILPVAQCLDPQMARGWTQMDNGDLLVDAGRNKYRMRVAPACTALSYSNFVGFRGDPITGRVCGGFRDAVLTRDYPCKIEGMQRLSKEEYEATLKADKEARKARKTSKEKAKAEAK
ncbi:DUF6491 family protein [Arenimonas sp.]|uniref:DUF6491 family protein n=1 Tax=Arenimonas sp. TaxID=1872635 RepID=UPI0039E66BCC